MSNDSSHWLGMLKSITYVMWKVWILGYCHIIKITGKRIWAVQILGSQSIFFVLAQKNYNTYPDFGVLGFVRLPLFYLKLTLLSQNMFYENLPCALYTASASYSVTL